VEKEGSVLTSQISSDVIDILAKLIRYKMIHWEWDKIIDGKEKEVWDQKQVFEALSAAINYKSEEKSHTAYFYVISMGREKFVVIKDPLTARIKVYYPLKPGCDLRTEKPFLEFTEEMLEDLGH